MNPEGFELTCNGIDDDCDSTTPDTEDEYCGDDVDNDCDSRIDEGCDSGDTGDTNDPGRGGTYMFSPGVSYSCAYGLVAMNFTGLVVQETGGQLYISAQSGGGQPGTMSGPSATDFVVSNTISGACTEVYELDATFTSDDQIDGVFSVSFIASTPGYCFDCVDSSWNISATRAQ